MVVLNNASTVMALLFLQTENSWSAYPLQPMHLGPRAVLWGLLIHEVINFN